MASRVWASARRDGHPASWYPFNGSLQSSKGTLHALVGVAILPGNVAPWDYQLNQDSECGKCANQRCNCWVDATQLCLAPPSIRPAPAVLRPGQEIEELPETACGWLLLSQKPRLLGIMPPSSENQRTSRPKVNPPALSVMISTHCCGAGLESVSVEWDTGSGTGVMTSETDVDGMCPVVGLSEGEHQLKIQHPRLPPQRFIASLTADSSALDNLLAEPLVLPCLCEPQLYICAIGVDAGAEHLCQKVLLCGHLDCIPEGAVPFPGRVLILGGRRGSMQVLPSGSGGDTFSPLPLSASSYAGRCPASAIRLEVDEDEFLWCPAEPWPLTTGCACRTVLAAGTLELGILRRFIKVQHVTGQKFKLPNEDYRTVGQVRAHLATELGLFSPPLGFVSGGGNLIDDEKIPPGEALQVLTRVLVRISLGSSRVPVPNVQVSLENGEQTQTDASGVCLLCAPPGDNWIIATGRVFTDGEKRRHVRLKKINEELRLAADINLYIYMLKPAVEMENACASALSEPCTVWVAGHRDQMPEAALPISGSARAIMPNGQEASCTFNPTEVTIFSLPANQAVDPSQVDVGRSSSLPIQDLSVICKSEGFIWQQTEPNPLVLHTEAWHAWPAAPMQVGKLCPAAEILCHGLGDQKFNLATSEFGTAGAVLAHLAPKLGVLVDRLAFFVGERRLTGRDPIRPGLEYGIWPLAQIDVMVCAPCCGAGLPGIHVAVDEEDVDQNLESLLRAGVRVVDSLGRNGVIDSVTSRACKVEFDSGSREVVPRANLTVSDDRKLGATNTAGICSFLSPVGEHRLCAWHPDLGPDRGAAPSTTIFAERGSVNRCAMSVSMSVFLYSVTVPGNSKQVYLCSRRMDIPSGAEPVEGTLQLGSHESTSTVSSLTFSGKAIEPVEVEGMSTPTGYAGVCPVSHISATIQVEGFMWCPEGSSQPRMGCGLARVLRNPTLVGTLVATVKVAPKNNASEQIEVPLYSRNPEAATAAAICYELAKSLGVSREPNIALFRKGGSNPIAPEEVLKGGDQLEYILLAPINIVARTRCCHEPLVGAEVKIDDGTICGMTNNSGQLSVQVELGHHELSLSHRSFGEKPLTAQVEVLDVMGATAEISNDVALFIYVTDPEVDKDGVAESLPSLVWVAGSKDQIPEDARPLAGEVQFGDVLKTNLDLPLQLQSLRLPCRPKRDASGVCACALGTLKINATPENRFIWKAKEPSPVAERLAEIGGCEYLRLMNCPAAIGFLRPTFTAKLPNGEQLSLVAENFGSVGDLRKDLACRLACPPELLQLRRRSVQAASSSQISDLDHVVPHQNVDVELLGSLTIRLVMGCCESPLEGVVVMAQCQELISQITDANGVCTLHLPAGSCKVVLSHQIFGLASREISVDVDNKKPGEYTVRADALIFPYITGPGPQDPKSQPSIVWLAADKQQIPEDAEAFAGEVVYNKGSEDSILSSPSLGSPASLHFDVTEDPNSQRPCGLRSVRFCCEPRGSLWCPKNPSPLAERVCEIGGCEYLRLLHCPVAVATIKPRLIVHCPSGEKVELAAQDYQTIGDLHRYMSSYVKSPEDLVYLKIVGDDDLAGTADPVLPGMEVEMVLYGWLALHVAAGCCGTAVEGVRIQLGGEDVGVTGDDGRFKTKVETGKHGFRNHSVFLKHDVFGKNGKCVDVGVTHLNSKEHAVVVDPSICAYMTKNDDALGEASVRQVWLCANEDHIPDEAESVCGNFGALNWCNKELAREIPSDTHNVITLSLAGSSSQIASGKECSRCKFSTLSITCEKDGFAWCAKKPSPLLERVEALGGCEMLRLLNCPVVLGSLKPKVTVLGPEGQSLAIPLDDGSTCSTLSEELSVCLNCPPQLLDILLNGKVLAGTDPVVAGQSFTAIRMGWISLKFLSGCCGDGIPGASITIDGMDAGITDGNGAFSARVKIGARKLLLRHVGLGPAGREVHVEVLQALTSQPIVIKLASKFSVYITDPEQTSLQPGQAPDPSLLWICGNESDVPNDRVAAKGHVTARARDGTEVSQVLTGDDVQEIEFDLDTVGNSEAQENHQCPFGSVAVDCIRDRFKWCPKEISPLAERLSELGGCEYLRFLECPVAIGFLRPECVFHCPDGGELKLPLEECLSVSAAQAELAIRLESPPDLLSLCSMDGAELHSNDVLTRGQEVKVLLLGELKLKFSTSCCGEAVKGAKVILDGSEKGITDSDGVCQVRAAIGARQIILSPSGHSFTVDFSNSKQELDLVAQPRVFTYIQEPEVCEDCELPDVPDPSLVWIAGKKEDVPDEALPCKGKIQLHSGSESQVLQELSGSSIEAQTLDLKSSSSPDAAVVPRCAFGGLHLAVESPDANCTWDEKDPSPLTQRVEEIGGCEYLRVLECPVMIGFLRK
eukprot:gnl/MRDRNA2_/MRDRNA2_78441_c0_seq1.p1 gnl/MRDRNA2_/MRDRNA2_78441_c0~~gnl/MRDRNA2_/MRDRNA2_78441_c0_seq1.p1  ORF type:complete len:2386 (+),score=403.99 gnl/MRDRNA2_/MRDRNA2_78441_c0_seq1:32-7159(+)